MGLESYSIPASDFVSAIQRNRVDHVLTVPDWVQLALHAQIEAGIPGVDRLNCCNENQTLTVAAGLTIGGKRPLVMMQNQGLYNCVNTLRAVCLDAHIPLVLLVGQFGREYDNLGQEPTASRRTMVRIMEPMLKAIDIPFFRLDTSADLTRMDHAYALAREKGTAVVLLVSAPIAWS